MYRSDSTPGATFAQRLLGHARVRPHGCAMREKRLGIWHEWNWLEVNDEVRALACGLAAQGFERGMTLAIIGDNRPRLYWTMLAAQCLGGIPVPLYQDTLRADLALLLDDAQITFAVVEDQEQVDKLTELALPGMRMIAFDDGRGMRHYDLPELLSLDQLQETGRAFDLAHPGYFDDAVDQGRGEDTAIILYTSGTTGNPKGVCQSHAALLAAGTGCVAFDRLTEADNILAYLPLAWVGDCLFSVAQPMVAGFTVNCPESTDTVLTDLREIGPSLFFAPPRVLENMLTSIMIRIEDGGLIRRRMFAYFIGVAQRCGCAILDRKSVSLSDRLAYALGNILVYGPLKNVLGLSRVRVAYTAGAVIGPDLFRFYRAIGINLKQLYGLTETCAYACLQPDGEIAFDSVGVPAPGVEIKLADTGEVLVKSPGLMQGYFRQADATAVVIDADGYFHTGDAGVLEANGQLRIIDRAADLGRMSSGALFMPNHLENKLRFFHVIKEAVVFGHQRDRVCAFVNIDLAAVGSWADRRGIAWAGYTELAAHPDTYTLVHDCITQVNAQLATDPALAHAQIHRFLVLHKELDPDDGELTRTRKVRRAFIADKYAPLIDALYAGHSVQAISTDVRFEDGRTGTVHAELRIADAATCPPSGPQP